MKDFINKILIFSGFGIILFIGMMMIVHLILSEFTIPDMELEEKIISLPLDSTKLNIIVAGDSRAERQIIPKIFEDQFQCNCINIATNSCDLVTVLNSIKRNYKSSKFRMLFIISVSSFQANDGAIDDGYISLISFSKLTIIEKIMLYKSDIVKLRGIINRGLKNVTNYFHNQIAQSRTFENKGFFPIVSNLDSIIDKKSYLNKHPWYKDINLQGARTRILKESLDSLGKMPYNFIILQAPISPYFRDMIKDSEVEKMENNFSLLIKNYIHNYSNIDFIDFYKSTNKSLDNSCFYDPQHLNIIGANIFTNILLNEINSIKKFPIINNDK